MAQAGVAWCRRFDLPTIVPEIATSNRTFLFVLTPGRYVGAEEQEDDGEPFAEKFPRLVAELEKHFAEGERLTGEPEACWAIMSRLESRMITIGVREAQAALSELIPTA